MQFFTEITSKNQELRTYYQINNIDPTHKYCSHCKEKKELSSFSKNFDKHAIFHVENICKLCQKAKRTKYVGDPKDLTLDIIVNHNIEVRKLNKELKVKYQVENIKPTHKYCSQCGELKEISEFNFNNRTLFNVSCKCKMCEHNNSVKYNCDNKELVKIKNSKKYQKNREFYLEQNKKYRSAPEIKNARNIKAKEKRDIDLAHNVKIRLRNSLVKFMKGQKTKKSNEYGIDWNKCVEHLGSKPNTTQKWQIDHIIPCNYFDFTNPTHPAVCFHHTNLRWCLESENASKKDKLIPELIHRHNLQWILDFLNISLDS